MSKKQHEILRCVRAAVEAEGARVVGTSHTGSGNQRIDFEIAGRRGFYFFSNTPSQAKDRKAIACARRVVRRTAAGEHAR
jgi:hypothetical protein